MGACSDPSVKHLKKFGYNVVLHPKSDISPLQLIGEYDGARDRIGNVSQLVENSSAPLPTITIVPDATNLTGKKTAKLEIGLGIDILGEIVGALGGSKIGVSAAFSKASSVEFSYEDVECASINIIDLGTFLMGGAPKWDHLVISRYLNNPGNLYIITETVLSKKLKVTAFGKNGQKLGLDVPIVQKIAGGKLSVSHEAESTDTIAFEGDVALAFGCKVFELSAPKKRDGTRSLQLTPVKAGGMVISAAKQQYTQGHAAPVVFPSLIIDL